METNTVIKTTKEKENFLKHDLIKLLQKLSPEDKGEWGALNAQQVTEHLCDSFRNYHGLDSKKILTPLEHLPKYKEFLLSEKPFKPHTKNIEMPEIPAPVRHPDMKSAVEELKTEMNNFFNYFEKDKSKTMINVFFGELNYEESIQLLHKHAAHHLKQFRLLE
jgi:site-specific recombinase XerC